MKANYLIFLLFATSVSGQLIAQITIDTNLPLRYEQTRKSFPTQFLMDIDELQDLLKEFEEINEFNKGEAFFTLLNIDTLNLSELKFKDYSGIEILSLDGLPVESTVDSMGLYRNRYKFTEGELIEGGVSIHISCIFGENFRLEIYGGDSISAHFAEIYWDIPTLALSPKDSFNDRLEVPVILKKLELTTKDFSVGDILYGYCEMETKVPYYQSDSELDGQFLELSKEFAFFFKVPINRSSGKPINRW